MEKIFVLDTSVILHDANSILKFGNSIVHIPLVVVEEIDKFKRDQNENGRNARQFSRLVDELRGKGSLSHGVKLDNGGTLFITVDRAFSGRDAQGLDFKVNDNLILSKALLLREDGANVTLVTKDINLRLKADAMGVHSEDYGKSSFSLEELYPGKIEVTLPLADLQEFEANKFLDIAKLNLTKPINPNEYVIMTDVNNPQYRLVGRYMAKKKGIIPLIKQREGIWGIYPKNLEQQMAFDSLMNNEVRLVSLVGKAGTGKTLLAIAAGLEMTLNQEAYSRVLVSRPIMPMGKDLGFLPGDVSEKLGPWMQPIFDNIDFLFNNKNLATKSSWENLIEEGLLHVEPLTYIRGRSLPKQYLIVDEAQNLTPHEIKTIITRVGEGTKIVLTGDCEQIDNPYLDSVNNGLAYSVDRLKQEEIVSHITLTVGERSELSEIASKLL